LQKRIKELPVSGETLGARLRGSDMLT
jgi:hypothetical protein